MITIIGERGSGKAKQLLEQAHINNAIILTKDKRGFEVKAKTYGYEGIQIIDYEDLEKDNFPLARPVLIHNVEYAVEQLLNKYYGIEVLGFSATKQEG